MKEVTLDVLDGAVRNRRVRVDHDVERTGGGNSMPAEDLA